MSAETRSRFVLDTNVTVSALAFPRSKPRRVFDLAHQRGVLLASADTIEEMVRTLRRPKLAAYITRAEREAFLHAFSDAVEFIEATEHVSVCRDPRDDKFLELALAGRADYLITGDRDLLILGSFRGTAILTPADFLSSSTRRAERQCADVGTPPFAPRFAPSTTAAPAARMGGQALEFIFGLIVLVLDIWAIVNIVGSSASTGAKILWTLLIIFLPIIGFIIWFFAGPRSRTAPA